MTEIFFKKDLGVFSTPKDGSKSLDYYKVVDVFPQIEWDSDYNSFPTGKTVVVLSFSSSPVWVLNKNCRTLLVNGVGLTPSQLRMALLSDTIEGTEINLVGATLYKNI